MKQKELPKPFYEDAMVLSENGWKNLKDIEKDEKLHTLNYSTKEIELQPIQEKTENEISEEMYWIYGRNINTLVSPEHQFLLIDRYGKEGFFKVEDIFNERTKYGHSYIPKSGNWNVVTPEFYTLKGIENVPKKGNYVIDPEMDSFIDYKVFAQFLGIWLAEGYTQKNSKTSVSICQKKEPIKEKIRELLSKFPKEMKWSENENTNETEKGISIFTIRDFRLASLLKENFGTNCYNKKIPQEFKNLSSELLNEIIYWFNLGDGRFNTIKQTGKDGIVRTFYCRNVFSSSKQLILDLNEILLKSGSCGNLTTLIINKDVSIRNRIVKAENIQPLYELNIGKTKGIHLDKRFLKIEKVKAPQAKKTSIKIKNDSVYCLDNGKAFWSTI
jgi:hypothetical protein